MLSFSYDFLFTQFEILDCAFVHPFSSVGHTIVTKLGVGDLFSFKRLKLKSFNDHVAVARITFLTGSPHRE